MKHIHHFKSVGGGCRSECDDQHKRCDMDYLCKECGEKFRVYTSFQGYTYLPREFDSKVLNELEKEEHKSIKEMLDQPPTPTIKKEI